MTKLIVAFRNFANAPKNTRHHTHLNKKKVSLDCSDSKFGCHTWYSYFHVLQTYTYSTYLFTNKPTDSVVMWSELTWFMWSDFILKWSEVSYGEVLGDKSAMHIRMTLYWGYLIVFWLSFRCILYCGCFNLFCNVWVFW